MSVSGLVFLLIWGLLIALILVLFWHPQLQQSRRSCSVCRKALRSRMDPEFWPSSGKVGPDWIAVWDPCAEYPAGPHLWHGTH